MNKKEKGLLRQLLQIHSTIVSVMSEENAENISLLLKKLDSDLKNVIGSSAQGRPDFWKVFAKMSDDDIRSEFSDIEKYPTVASIKTAMRGILDMSKVSKVKTREALIEHILKVRHRDDYIRDIMKGVGDEQ